MPHCSVLLLEPGLGGLAGEEEAKAEGVPACTHT